MLVTAIKPTPAGEGKTTTTVGLGRWASGASAARARSSRCASRRSGPVFGVKGGAAGGGRAQIAPMEDINLHFTGDFHAIGAAHNLLAAMLDNHLHWATRSASIRAASPGRASLDMNDRALRDIVLGLGGTGARRAARERLRHHRRLAR